MCGGPRLPCVWADNGYDAFTELIRNLTADFGKVVILVDEYDKPLLAHIGQSPRAAYRKF